MLSKLNYYAENSPEVLWQSKLEAYVSTLPTAPNKSNISKFLPTHGGTLGVNYIAEHSNGTESFFKTHLNHMGARENLLKEIIILDFLYGNEINCKKIENEGDNQTWLWMNRLVPLSIELDPPAILGLIENYSQKFSKSNINQCINPADNFIYLLEKSKLTLKDLDRQGYLSTQVKKSAQNALLFIGKKLHQLTPTICHGDLGPKNIMSIRSKSLVIDWEDAFFGFEGYDFLYWLTFFKNRKYYSPYIFGNTPLGQELELSIMILILILKSGLALSSGEYSSHSISINDRILEILSIKNNIVGL